MCRCIAFGVLALAAFFMGGAQAAGLRWPPVDCEHAQYTPQTTICNDATLRARDRAISAAYNRLLPRFKGEERKTFATGHWLWLGEVNECRNRGVVDLIRECVATRFSEREAMLAMLRADPTKLATTVADYSSAPAAYLLKFARQFEGKTIRVSGGMTIEACDAKKKDSLKGHLDNILEVRFKSLPDNEIEFLCEKSPAAWWRGTVRLDHGRPYLYATDVLGTQLP
jgi:uncharacterized protein YecT (DUF1311 family)